MATKKAKAEPKRPRLQITPSPELWRLIDLVHARTGQPKSGIVSELLDQAQPAVVMLLQALELAAEAPREAQRLLTNFSADAVGQLMQAQLDLDKAITDKRTVKGKRAKRGASGRTP